jgi:hypothetical protein
MFEIPRQACCCRRTSQPSKVHLRRGSRVGCDKAMLLGEKETGKRRRGLPARALPVLVRDFSNSFVQIVTSGSMLWFVGLSYREPELGFL